VLIEICLPPGITGIDIKAAPDTIFIGYAVVAFFHPWHACGQVIEKPLLIERIPYFINVAGRVISLHIVQFFAYRIKIHGPPDLFSLRCGTPRHFFILADRDIGKDQSVTLSLRPVFKGLDQLGGNVGTILSGMNNYEVEWVCLLYFPGTPGPIVDKELFRRPIGSL